MSNKDQTIRKLSVKEQVAVVLRLQEVLTRVGENCWAYEAGHSDETLAAEFECNPAAIAYRRRHGFGPFPDSAQRKEEGINAGIRLNELERQQLQHQSTIIELTKHLTRLQHEFNEFRLAAHFNGRQSA